MNQPRCIREGKYKLIQIPYKNRQELYDVIADPYEQNDLLLTSQGGVSDVALELSKKTVAWAESANPLPPEGGKDFEMSQDTIERLQSLGYLQD